MLPNDRQHEVIDNTGIFLFPEIDSAQWVLMHYVPVKPYGDIISSDNGLLPNGTKPLPESMLTYQLGPMTVTWVQFHKRYINHQ